MVIETAGPPLLAVYITPVDIVEAAAAAMVPIMMRQVGNVIPVALLLRTSASDPIDTDLVLSDDGVVRIFLLAVLRSNLPIREIFREKNGLGSSSWIR